MRRIRRHLTYANVMATIAVFGMLAGAGAYAASKIGPKDIKRNAVHSKHIQRAAVTTRAIARGAVTNSRLRHSRPYAWGQVRADASLRPVSSRVVGVTRPSTGIYCVQLSGSPEQSELEGSAVTLAGTTSQALFPHVTNGQGADCANVDGAVLRVRFYAANGTLTNARFSFVVP